MHTSLQDTRSSVEAAVSAAADDVDNSSTRPNELQDASANGQNGRSISAHNAGVKASGSRATFVSLRPQRVWDLSCYAPQRVAVHIPLCDLGLVLRQPQPRVRPPRAHSTTLPSPSRPDVHIPASLSDASCGSDGAPA